MKQIYQITLFLSMITLSSLMVSGQNPEFSLTNNIGQQGAQSVVLTNVLYDQLSIPSNEGGMASQEFNDFPAYSCEASDDFIVPAGEIWTISEIKANGTYTQGGGIAQLAHIYVYTNDPLSNIPGTLVLSLSDQTVISTVPGNLSVNVSANPLILNPGHYWISVVPHMPFNPNRQWYWGKQESPDILNIFYWRNPGGGWNVPGSQNWIQGYKVIGGTDNNLSFALIGTSSPQVVCPTAYAGADATINSDESYFLADATATDYSSIVWATSGSGSFDDPYSLNPTYTPGTSDFGNTIELTLKAMPLSPCTTTASDFMKLTVNQVSAFQTCCPQFILKDALHICPPEGACKRGTAPNPGGTDNAGIAACKNSPHVYTVYPNDISFTYNWTVIGGTPVSYTGNPLTVTWGNGNQGYIKVVISNLASGGNCLDSIAYEVCLIDGPTAAFTASDDTICQNTPITFTNTSTGGSVFFWDFGDGTTSNLPNPPNHAYQYAGTYTVTLTVTDMGAGQYVGGQQGETKVPCGCSDTATMQIVVLAGQGPVIETDCCYGTVCPDETSSFCTPMVCGTYNWSVTGGTIVTGAGTNCITVLWNPAYSGPTTVTLQSCPGSGCPGSTTINVPVLYTNLPIVGPTQVCEGASATYTLPTLPGTYYKWTVTGGMYTFNLQDRNTPTVNITFNSPGTFWVKCIYTNPLAGCNGVDSIQVDVLPVFSIFGDAKVCENTAINYTANGPANWSVVPAAGATILAGNGTPSVFISFAPGNYTVYASPVNPAAYCNDTAFKTVEVVAKPVLGVITGPTVVCPGEKYEYQVTSNLTGSPFFWTVTSNVGTVLAQMGDDGEIAIIDFTLPGPWIVNVYQQIELSPGVYCQSLTQTLNVQPFPTPVITGALTVCVDAVQSYSAGVPTPPGDFEWTINPPSQGTILGGQGTNNVTIMWHGPAGSAVLKVETCTGFDTKTITINGPPPAVASYNILPLFCLNGGQTLILSTPSGGGYSYQWFKNGNPVPGGINPTLTLVNNLANFPAPGTYQFQVVVTQNGCSTTSNIVNVIIEDCTAGGTGGTPGGTGCVAIAFFRPYVVCSTVNLVDRSVVAPPSTITNYSWTVSGPGIGTFSPNANVPSPTLNVTASGTYTITLTVTSSSGCTSTWTEIVNILLPVASFNYTTPVCVGVPASFTAIPNNPLYNYFWTFGDGYTSYLPVTQHAYALPSPPPYNVTLTITDQYGCVATVTQPIIVNPVPVCTIVPSDTIFCPGDSVLLTACNGMSSYQWYKKGVAISGATSPTYYVTSYGEYYAVVTNSYGCTSKTNKVFIYMHQKPKAKITADAHVCGDPNGTVYFMLNAYYDMDYVYSWSSNPGGATFSPPNTSSTWASITLPPTLPVSYEFIVQVTDTTTNCINSDTVCIWFFENPSFTIPYATVCEGNTLTLTPTPVNTTLYSYQWNNGATTPSITATAPGVYILTVTDKANGCSSTVTGGMIYSLPDLSLFPIGCDSICKTDSIHMYIPLPLNALFPNNTFPMAYPSITWYANNNWAFPIGYGQNFWYFPNLVGNYQISVVVSNSFGCVDTAGVFCLKVKDCPVNPPSDFGDAPDVPGNPLDYPTLLASGGAQHIIVPGVFMGSFIDAEIDGQPNVLSTGDDIAGAPDDEDGVNIPAVINQGASVNFTVSVSVTGFLDSWIDYNLDGDWADAGEHIFINTPLNLPVNPLSFTVPFTATVGQSYMRFRFRTTSPSITEFGLVNNGEVEDYAVYIEHCDDPTIDFGDAPDDPASMFDYPTVIASNGAGHLVVPGIYLGSKIDPELDGQPSIGADCDDNNCLYAGVSDDEDGVTIPAAVTQGSLVNISVVASVNGFLDAWFDFNLNGDWSDAGEHIFTTQFVSAGANALSFTVPATATPGQSYARFRFRTMQAPITFSGLLFNGEVEDYAVHIDEHVPTEKLDFGDAPQNEAIGFNYPTLLSFNGARHIIVPTIYLGAKIDSEADGQPDINSMGDDNDLVYPSLGDDEDGVTMPAIISPGSTVNITVVASIFGYLDAWIDYNMDGDWADAGEHIFTVQPVNAGSNTLSFNVPTNSFLGQSYSRFRFRTFKAAINYDGLINEGEVEDYAVIIESFPQDQLDHGDAPDGAPAGFNYPTLGVNNGARHILNSAVYLGNLIDTEPDGQPNIGATGDDIDLLYPSSGDDEDGVKFIGTMFVGKTATVQVTASVPGFLNAWMDFDKNGDWTAAPEQIFNNQAVNAGVNTLTFIVPTTALTGKTYLRFRYNTAGGLTYTGLAMDGEIEDYQANTCPYWNPIPTPVSHIIAIPSDIAYLEPGDAIGVFFTGNDGALKCGGLVEWTGMENQVMIAYGDDPTTPNIKEGFIVGEPIKWILCKPIRVLPVDVLYDPQLPSHDGRFANGGMSALVNFVGMGVTVTASPESTCAGGEVQLTATPNGPEMLTYQWTSDPSGFVSDEQNPVVYPEVSTTYYLEAFDGVFTNLYSVSVSVNPVQVLDIKAGWGGVSTYIKPLVPDVTEMFAPMGDQLTILYNYFGVYWPSQGVNSIGNWNEYHGYIIKSAGQVELPVCGTEITSKTINLARGWNVIPVLCSSDVNVAELFASIQNPVVKDIAGPGVYWPAYGVNTLVNLKPGAAYYANVPDPTTLYQSWTCLSVKTQPDEVTVQSPWNEITYTPETHLVAFTNQAVMSLEIGDIIGGFTQSGLCAGYVGYNGTATGLAINGDDAYTQIMDGFSNNEPISYRLYRPSTGEMFDVEVTYDPSNNNAQFASNGLSVVNDLKLSPLGTGDNLMNHIRIFPNPSTGVFTISGSAENVKISVLNAFGSEVYHTDQENLPLTLDFSAKSKGMYMVRIESGKSVIYQKLVIE